MTHYPLLAELEDQHPEAVGNFHMAYVEADTSECLSVSTMYFQKRSVNRGGKSLKLWPALLGKSSISTVGALNLRRSNSASNSILCQR